VGVKTGVTTIRGYMFLRQNWRTKHMPNWKISEFEELLRRTALFQMNWSRA